MLFPAAAAAAGSDCLAVKEGPPPSLPPSLPPSPLLRPERRVHRRMPPESPHQETGCCASEISRVLTG